jgi:hypothetical protein
MHFNFLQYIRNGTRACHFSFGASWTQSPVYLGNIFFSFIYSLVVFTLELIQFNLCTDFLPMPVA